MGCLRPLVPLEHELKSRACRAHRQDRREGSGLWPTGGHILIWRHRVWIKKQNLIGLKKTLGWAFSLVQSHLLVTSQLRLLFPLLLSLPIFLPPFFPSFLSLMDLLFLFIYFPLSPSCCPFLLLHCPLLSPLGSRPAPWGHCPWYSWWSHRGLPGSAIPFRAKVAVTEPCQHPQAWASGFLPLQGQEHWGGGIYRSTEPWAQGRWMRASRGGAWERGRALF